MSFGTDLSNEFKKLAVGNHYDEVQLFTKLQDAFITLSTGKYQYAIDIIHGQTSQVCFTNSSTWITGSTLGTTLQCELSDMMFILFSNTKSEIRLMYMQNKKDQSRKRNIAQRFKADLVQLHLLHDRKEITSINLPACVFNDRRILSGALLPSVASYGLFYFQNNDVDMAYYPASNIEPLRSPQADQKRAVKYTQPSFGTVNTSVHGYNENQGEQFLSKFGDELVDMNIGTPILHTMVSHKEIIRCLRDHSKQFSKTRFFQNLKSSDTLLDEKPFNVKDFPFTCIIDVDKVRECMG